jgi:hypothetical protein
MAEKKIELKDEVSISAELGDTEAIESSRKKYCENFKTAVKVEEA